MSALVVNFPLERAMERLSNSPRMEWLFRALEGHPNVRKKSLIIQARSPEVGFIDDQTAAVLIDALGLAAY
jgi:hypothetical protein